MEILVLSCGMGGGHNAAGQAVADELQRRGHSVVFMNAFHLNGKKIAAVVNGTYIKIAQRTPGLFGFIYFLGNSYRKLPIKSPVYWANGKMAGYVEDFLKEHHFDAVVMTHIFPAQTFAKLKEEQVELPKTFLVATDYTCIPFMEEADCDYCVIPSEELTAEFCGYGFDKEKLLPFGIPVRREFVEEKAKADVRGQLGWKEDDFCVLLTGGSIGAGRLTEAIGIMRTLLAEDKKNRLIVVCGNNRKLYKTLERKYGTNEQICLLRKTSQMADYMKACDVLISKPGGLTSTEAAAAGVPLIHISPIPGCESRNFRFFEKHRMSIAVRDLKKELLPAIRKTQDSAFAEQMRQAQHKNINRFSTKKLCDFIEQLPRSN